MNTIDITGPKGRTIKNCEALAENVVKHVTKTGKANYYILDRVTGDWKFSHEKRFNGLVKRFGSVEAISDRYLTPVAVEIIRTQPGHEYEYLLDKQPGVTRTRKPKATKTAPVEPEGEVDVSKKPLRDAKGRFVKKEVVEA